MNEKAKAAVALIKKGFEIVVLHGIDKYGNCTCSHGSKCTKSGKHPLYKGWQSKATMSETEILAVLKKYPNANFAIDVGKKVFVVDTDAAHGGFESLKPYGKMKKTVSVKTGGGGSHQYYQRPEGMKIPNIVDLLRGVDIKADGGLIVIPGSKHKSGNFYEWMPGCSPDEIEIAEPDSWLFELIDNYVATKNMNSANVAKEIPEIIEEGSRNVIMASMAGALRRKGLSYEAIVAALAVENEKRCNPPLEDSEIEVIAKSISKYKPEDPATGEDWNEETKKHLLETITNLKDYSKVYELELLSLLSLASKKDPAAFAVIKSKLKGHVSLNDLQRAIKHRGKEEVNNKNDFDRRLELEGIETNNLLIPKGWKVSVENGVTHCIHNGDGSEREITASFVPIIISSRFHNLDSGYEKIELSFYRDGSWKKILSPRSVVFNRNSILRLADNGFSVSSNSSGDLISYLTDFEQANDENIPIVKSVSRLGWLKGGGFFPFCREENLEFESDSKEAATIMSGLETSGDAEQWLHTARKARENPAARFVIATSFASVLLEPLHKRVFFVHLWHNSRSGKTATLRLALSAWGNPHKLIGSFNSTIVGLERRASSLRNLPFGIDELQVLNSKRISIDSIIYMLSQGQGRTRGGRDGGLQETLTWRNIIITTGEEALLGSNTQDGANSRTFEIYEKPVEDTLQASKMHEIAEQHYGHAGSIFIEKLCLDLKNDPSYLSKLYEHIKENLRNKYPESIHVDEVAVVCLGDYLSSVYVFGEDEASARKDAEAVSVEMLGNNRQLTQTDNIERAWETFSGWLIANSTRFGFDAPSPQYGRIDENKNYLVISSYAHKALEDSGFSPKKVIRGFAERGYIESIVDSEGIRRFQLAKSMMGKTCRVYVVKVPEHQDEEIEPLLFG